ncbi:IS66 family transposase [Flavitalea flava]
MQLCIYDSIFAIVNADHNYILSTTPHQTAFLQADLNDAFTEERIFLGKIINDVFRRLYLKEQEFTALQSSYWQMQEQTKTKDERISVLETGNHEMKSHLNDMTEKVEEGIKNGWQLEEFKRMLFGHKSERYTAYSSDITPTTQPSLGNVFDTEDIEAVIAASRARTTATQELQEKQAGQKTNRHIKHHHVHRGKRNRKSDKLEVVTHVVDYEGDKTGLKSFGKKVVTVFDYKPGTIVKTETHYLKYINKEGEIFKEAVLPRIIEKGTVSNRLVAQFHIEKFVYYMPYYRQLQKLKRLGISFAASTVNDWEEICYRKLKRLLKLMKKIIQQQDYLQMDEVYLKYVNDVGKGKCSNGYFWVVRVPDKKMVLFEFHASRGAEVPMEMLKDFKGKLQTDGYAGYKSAFNDNDVVTLITCLVHIRRGFIKAVSNNKVVAEYFLNETRIIYDIESFADRKQLTPEQRKEVRQKHLKPILDQLTSWIAEQKSGDSFPPDSPIAKAITFADNHWHMMYELLKDGRLLLDNNGVERAIRPVTLYRKNSLFAGNEHGAGRAALYFSLLETCKLNNIDPYEYLCDIYDRIHDCPAHQLEALLPHKWTPSTAIAS